MAKELSSSCNYKGMSHKVLPYREEDQDAGRCEGWLQNGRTYVYAGSKEAIDSWLHPNQVLFISVLYKHDQWQRFSTQKFHQELCKLNREALRDRTTSSTTR